MGHLKWYARDPRAALIGMMEMSLVDRGAYTTCLDLIYINDGALPDDAAKIAKYLGISSTAWLRIRERLISSGKLYVRDGFLRNERADLECKKALRRLEIGTTAGLISLQVRRQAADKPKGR